MKRVPMIAALVVLLIVAVGGFLFLRKDSADPEASAPPSAPLGEVAVKEATQAYLGANPPQAEAVATGTGVVYARAEDSSRIEAPGALRILAVDVSSASTHVRLSLSSDSEQEIVVSEYADSALPGLSSTTLVAEQADLSMTGAEWTGANKISADCTCGRRPAVINAAGVEVSLLFPALPAEVTEIQLKMPGFVPLTAPVNRLGTP